MARYSQHASPNASDRVWLNVPFAQKDAAKAMGARWDPIQGRWWITRKGLAETPGVHRWVPEEGLARKLRAALEFRERGRAGSRSRGNGTGIRSETVSTHRDPVVLMRSDEGRLPACECPVPPWEHCEHSLGPVTA